MNELPLRVKLKDAAKIQAKRLVIPLIIGAGFAVYRGADLLANPVGVILAVAAVFSIVILIQTRTANLTLKESGFTYPGIMGKNIECTWADNIEINNKVDYHGNYNIYDPANKRRLMVAAVVFTYPETKQFIYEYSPQNHKFRELASDS